MKSTSATSLTSTQHDEFGMRNWWRGRGWCSLLIIKLTTYFTSLCSTLAVNLKKRTRPTRWSAFGAEKRWHSTKWNIYIYEFTTRGKSAAIRAQKATSLPRIYGWQMELAAWSTASILRFHFVSWVSIFFSYICLVTAHQASRLASRRGMIHFTSTVMTVAVWLDFKSMEKLLFPPSPSALWGHHTLISLFICLMLTDLFYVHYWYEILFKCCCRNREQQLTWFLAQGTNLACSLSKSFCIN